MNPSFVILGSRGTMPVSGKSFVRYGGQTTCFYLKTATGKIIIDAGTGLSLLREKEREEALPATLLFTHFHLDHLTGLPFLKRLYNRNSSLELMADGGRKGWAKALTGLFDYPFWPALIKKAGARLRFTALPAKPQPIQRYGVKIRWCPLHHPQGSLAYRLETAGYAAVIVTDHECGNPQIDVPLLKFCANADYLIFDAQFKPAELKKYRGWGHNSWKEGVELAKRANVKELILTHHHYQRRDDELDDIVKNARRYFSQTRAARCQMSLF